MTSSTLEQPVDEQEGLRGILNNQIARQGAGVGVEIGGGYLTDIATAGMLAGGPIGLAGYALSNFASGAATNWAAQKLRGEEEISWGELISSGLVDIIPFFGQKLKGAKGVANVALQSGARTAAQRQGEVALDDQRWLTPRETLEAAALGGAFGAGFKGAGEGINILKGRYSKYGKNEARNLFPTEVVEELNNQNRLFDDDAIDDLNRLREGLNMRLRKSIDPDDLSADFTTSFEPSARISNLGGRGFTETSELLRAGVHPSHHKGDILYNYPQIPEGGKFLWEGRRIVDQPTPKEQPVDLGDGVIGSKNDIDLSTFDLSDPTKVSKQFEDLLRQALEIDQIGMKHLSHIGEKRSKVIAGHTGEDTVGLMWNDYLAGYFNKFIRSGKATNFDQAVRVKLPGGRVLKGDSTLARELRLWTIDPDVVDVGFSKAGTAPGSRQYQRDLARVVSNHNPGEDITFSNKFHAHHINVIEEEWPLVKGLNSPELVKMRALLKKHIKYPSGNALGNRLIVLDEIHDRIHARYWPQYARAFREAVNDPDFIRNHPTAASREEFVIWFGEIVEDMMNDSIIPDIDKAIRKAHIKYKFNITDDNVNDYVDQILEELEFERLRSAEKGFADMTDFDLIDEPTTQSELDEAFGQMQDDL